VRNVVLLADHMKIVMMAKIAGKSAQITALFPTFGIECMTTQLYHTPHGVESASFTQGHSAERRVLSTKIVPTIPTKDAGG